jgi:hypothetical protein
VISSIIKYSALTWLLISSSSSVAQSLHEQTQLSVYRGAGCTGRSEIPKFERFLGKKVTRTVDALDVRGWPEMLSSAQWISECWRDSGLEVTISIPMLPEQANVNLRAGAQGEYDQYFQHIARTLVRNGLGDSVVRIGWEFNGNWMPWSASQDPSSFIAFWRRIVRIFRAVEEQTFLFEWCPNHGSNEIDPTSVYPGDDVVDIIGMDVYNQTWSSETLDPRKRWEYFLEGPFGLRWHNEFAKRHGKMLAYSEWGTGTRPDGHGAGDDPLFIAKMADWIQETKPLYHNYWDYSAPDYDAKLSGGKFPRAAAEFQRRFGCLSASCRAKLNGAGSEHRSSSPSYR